MMLMRNHNLLILSFCLLGFYLVSSQNTFTDPKTQTVKSCHFSCAYCSDSSDLCDQCQPNMNFFIKESNKFRCFVSCPRGYQPSSGDTASISDVECVADSQQELRNLDAINQKLNNMCSLSEFWDGTQCKNCSSNCLSCSNSSICEECVHGFFFNTSTSQCQQCHTSCSSCKGPNFNDCLACSSVTNFYPDQNGICDKSATKMDIAVQYTKKSDLFSNLNNCQSFLKPTATSYSVQFKNLYDQNDAKWSNVELVDQYQCQIPVFSQKFSSLSAQISQCTFEQISKPLMSQKGSIVTSYAMILSQHFAQLNGALVNPQSLNTYINSQQLQSIIYMKKPRSDFSCDQLYCENKLNSQIPFVSTSSNTKVQLKMAKDIPLTQNGQTINCFDTDFGNIDDSKLNEIEIAMAQASISQKSSNVKLYAIVDVCGRTIENNSRVIMQSMLVNNYYGNGFLSAIRTDITGASQVQNLYLQGAGKTQNESLKQCNMGFTNQFESFSIQRVRFVEIQEVAVNFDKDTNRYNQYSSRGNTQVTAPSQGTKCIGIDAASLIISNDSPYNQLTNLVNSQNKILTSSIDLNDIRTYLRTLAVDENNLKAQKITLSDLQSQQLFDLYLRDLTAWTNSCYSSISKAPQNVQSVLIHFFLSNNKQCILQNEINQAIDNNDMNNLSYYIQNNQWCTTQYDKCAKSVQIIKGCL